MTSILSIQCTVALVEYNRADKTERPFMILQASESIGFVKGIEIAGQSLKDITAIFTRTLVTRENLNATDIKIDHLTDTIVFQKGDSESFLTLCKKASEKISSDEWRIFYSTFPHIMRRQPKEVVPNNKD